MNNIVDNADIPVDAHPAIKEVYEFGCSSLSPDLFEPFLAALQEICIRQRGAPIKRESVDFQIGDEVEVVKYPEWKGVKTIVCEIRRHIRDGRLTDEITYTTWSPGEGGTDGWDAMDLRKITRIEDVKP